MTQQLIAVDQMEITAFHGGRKRGPCLQFTIAQAGADYAQLTRGEVYAVFLALSDWLKKNQDVPPRETR